MQGSKGYRTQRLRRRRRSSVERSQAWLLYVLAAAVAFFAVLGAWYLASRLSSGEEQPPRKGYIAVLQLTAEGVKDPIGALLVVQDPTGRDPGVYIIPTDLLLEGPSGEYVFMADAMSAGTFKADLERLINAPLDAVYRVPVTDIARWAGAEEFKVELKSPATIDLPGGTRDFKNGDAVKASEIPEIFQAPGLDRYDTVALQAAVLKSALGIAALRPDGERTPLGGTASASPEGSPSLARIIDRITQGNAQVERFPTVSRVAEGQFAFIVDPDGVMSGITRRAPDYEADVTVRVLNGCGRVGVGQAAIDRLSTLDVNLPPAANADSFGYRQTQILCGPETLPLARDIRAILGRGVVLDGADLPPGTIEVIVGADFEAAN